MTMRVVLMMEETANGNGRSLNSSLTNQSGLTLLHPFDKPSCTPAMKGQGSGEPFVRPAACIWLYWANGEDGENRGPAEKW